MATSAREATPPPLRESLRAAAAPFIASRVVLFLFAWIALALSPPTRPGWRAFPDLVAIDGWARWDSAWYESIANRGYEWIPGKECNVNFFPLYPWLVGALSWPLKAVTAPNRAFFIAGMAVSLAAFWLALAGLHRLAAPRFGDAAARRALWLAAVFPFSLFFSAVYTEGLYLALTVWAFAFAAEERWRDACILASLVAVTRTVGALVAVALFAEYLATRRLRPDRQLWWFFVTPLPVLALAGWFWARFGEPLPFLKTYTTVWDKRPGIGRLIDVLNSVRHATDPWPLRLQNAVYVAVVFGAIAVAWWQRRALGWGMTAYVWLSAWLVVFTGFNGAGRYMAVLFPVFIGLARIEGRAPFRGLVAAQAPLALWFTWDFIQWMYVC